MRSDSRWAIAGMIATSALLAPCARAQVKPVTGWATTAPAMTGNAKASTAVKPGAAATSVPNWSGGAGSSTSTGFAAPTGTFTAGTAVHQPYKVDRQISQLPPVACRYIITARDADGLATAAHRTIINRSQTTYLTRTTSGNSTLTTGMDITTHYVFQGGNGTRSDPEGYYLPATLAPGASVDMPAETPGSLYALQHPYPNAHIPLSNATFCEVTALGPILGVGSIGSYPGS